ISPLSLHDALPIWFVPACYTVKKIPDMVANIAVAAFLSELSSLQHRLLRVVGITSLHGPVSSIRHHCRFVADELHPVWHIIGAALVTRSMIPADQIILCGI